MEIAALVAAALALLAAFLAWRRAAGLSERLDRATGTLHELRAAVSESREEFAARIDGMRLAMRSQAGEVIFSPQMTIAQALEVHPKVGEVLAGFHLGGCSHCAVSDVDTIEGACQTYGIDQKALLAALNSLAGGGSDSVDPAARVKVPNVKVSF